MNVSVRSPSRARGKASGRPRRGGQTMLEYIIVFGVLLATVTVSALFLYALRQQSTRVVDLVASDYP